MFLNIFYVESDAWFFLSQHYLKENRLNYRSIRYGKIDAVKDFPPLNTNYAAINTYINPISLGFYQGPDNQVKFKNVFESLGSSLFQRRLSIDWRDCQNANKSIMNEILCPSNDCSLVKLWDNCFNHQLIPSVGKHLK